MHVIGSVDCLKDNLVQCCMLAKEIDYLEFFDKKQDLLIISREMYKEEPKISHN